MLKRYLDGNGGLKPVPVKVKKLDKWISKRAPKGFIYSLDPLGEDEILIELRTRGCWHRIQGSPLGVKPKIEKLIGWQE